MLLYYSISAGEMPPVTLFFFFFQRIRRVFVLSHRVVMRVLHPEIHRVRGG